MCDDMMGLPSLWKSWAKMMDARPEPVLERRVVSMGGKTRLKYPNTCVLLAQMDIMFDKITELKGE